MSTRPGRFEIADTDAGMHVRWRYPGNLRIGWSTEVYGRERAALRLIEAQPGIRSVTHHSTYGWEANSWAPDSEPIEVRVLDERGAGGTP